MNSSVEGPGLDVRRVPSDGPHTKLLLLSIHIDTPLRYLAGVLEYCRAIDPETGICATSKPSS